MASRGKIACLGFGYWGKNLVRVAHELDALIGIVESEKERHAAIQSLYPGIPVVSCQEELSDTPDAVIVATPAETHHAMAKKALTANLDVFVEKPLALQTSQANELINLAKEQEKILMVGHLLQYHPAFLTIKEMIQSGELGQVEYLYSNRLNLGKIRLEENALWSFAPHDISVMLWLLNDLPLQAHAVGGSYLQPNIADTTISSFVFDRGVRAHVFVSWLHPFKEQKLVVVGSKKMVCFHAQAGGDRVLMVYDKGVTQQAGKFVVERDAGTPVPFDAAQEPLKLEIEHFMDCIAHRTPPRTDGPEGLRVLQVLEACQQSMELSGQPVQVAKR